MSKGTTQENKDTRYRNRKNGRRQI